jgi:hypothetical protein
MKASTLITMIGIRTPVIGKPNEVAFKSFIPWVSGKRFEAFCSPDGIISYGKVAPEKINIGKYSRLAIMPACFALAAMPPTMIPMLKMENITRRKLPENPNREPFKLQWKNTLAVI